MEKRCLLDLKAPGSNNAQSSQRLPGHSHGLGHRRPLTRGLLCLVGFGF